MITEFLEARIADDEAAARRCAAVFPGSWDVEDRGWRAHVVADGPKFLRVAYLDQDQAPDVEWLGGALQHFEFQQPTRVLAECAAKRVVLETLLNYEPEISWNEPDDIGLRGNDVALAVRALAAVYKDHPDYRPEWGL